ncbi:MAG TPA: hypothetical protein VM889_12610 [Candidatus Thermoplasmatota archaeon]|nr:hypothetical protein [Candidatus Thermoplasmatota archaeon]
MTAKDAQGFPLEAAPLPWGDDAGVEAIAIMLQDLEFPRTLASLRAQAGHWRVPVPGDAAIPLDEVLKRLPDKLYRDSNDVAVTAAKKLPVLRYPHNALAD